MSAKVFKYQLQITDKQSVPMPRGAQVLSIQMQQGKITIWALCPVSTAVHENRTFHIFGTGQDLLDCADASSFIATVQDGNYVGHIFEFK